MGTEIGRKPSCSWSGQADGGPVDRVSLCWVVESHPGAYSLVGSRGRGRRSEGKVQSRSLRLVLGLVWSGLVRPHEARPLFDRAFGGVQETTELQLCAGDGGVSRASNHKQLTACVSRLYVGHLW